jgi:hypothetical protein
LAEREFGEPRGWMDGLIDVACIGYRLVRRKWKELWNGRHSAVPIDRRDQSETAGFGGRVRRVWVRDVECMVGQEGFGSRMDAVPCIGEEDDRMQPDRMQPATISPASMVASPVTYRRLETQAQPAHYSEGLCREELRPG